MTFEPVRRSLSLDGDDWTVRGYVPGETAWRQVGVAGFMPATATGAVAATVPGDVVADLRDAGLIADPMRGRNSWAAEWVSQRDWVYSRSIAVPPEMRTSRLFLCFDSVDDACEVFVNTVSVGRHRGINTVFQFDVTDLLRHDGSDQLVVIVEHAPHEPEAQGQLGRTSAVRTWKPRFAYGWDFCTRLVTLGIPGSVRLEARGDAWLVDGSTRTRHRGDVWDLSAEATVTPRTHAVTVEAVLLDAAGAVVGSARVDVAAHTDAQVARVDMRGLDVETWEPNGNGAATLYECRLRLVAGDRVLDEQTLPVGFREIEFRRTEGAPDDALPYALVVNGRETFIRGWNWVPVDQLYGRPHEDRYRHLVEMARHAGCNLLRVWGGGYLERRLFYDLCDRAGILVWQEFPQSSSGLDSVPADDAKYLADVDAQARGMIVRRRMHPSLAVWCGGNELAAVEGRRPLSESTSPALRVLAACVADLDPERAFLPSSPSGPIFDTSVPDAGVAHDVHGTWWFLGDPEHAEFYNRCQPMLHSEFGAEGAASLSAIRMYLGDDDSWPPDHSNPTWTHHGGSWWANRERVSTFFGPIDDLPTFVRASRWLQALALGYPIAAQRRREGRCAGVIPWQLNEPWLNAGCTSAIDYTGTPKPAYWSVADLYRPVAVTVRYDRMLWDPDAEFSAEIWVCGERQTPLCLEWTLRDALDGTVHARGAAEVPTGASRSLRSATVTWRVPDRPAVWVLDAAVRHGETVVGARACAVFAVRSEAPFAPLLHAAADLDAGVDSGRLALRAVARPALGVSLVARPHRCGPGIDTGWLPVLWPNAPVEVGVAATTTSVEICTLGGRTKTVEVVR